MENDNFSYDSSNDLIRDHNVLSFNPQSYDANEKRLAILKSKRTQLILGRQINILSNNQRKIGKIIKHTPNPSASQTESIYVKGQSGSGKTWGVYNIIGQTFFSEARTWIVIDTKQSVDWSTNILIQYNNEIKKICIGEFIDQYIKDDKNLHEIYTPTDDIKVLSLTSSHKLEWKKVIQFSKHKPTSDILKIKTKSGKEVISTSSHSFLTLKDGKYISILGSQLKIGDHIPVADTIKLNESNYVLNVKEYLKNYNIIDYNLINETIQTIHNYKTIKEAYANSSIKNQIKYDTFIHYLNDRKKIKPNKFKMITENNSKSKDFFNEIQLDRETGFVFGLFLSKGCASFKKTKYVYIANTSEELLNKLSLWLNKYDIYHMWVKNNDKNKNYTYKGIRIQSFPFTLLLTKLFSHAQKTHSNTKFIPDILLNSNDEFLCGLIDGYMSGDGFIRYGLKKDLSFVTKSKQLRNDLNIIFTHFNMPLKFSQQQTKTGIIYTGSLFISDLEKFQQIGFSHNKKNEILKLVKNSINCNSKRIIDIKYATKNISNTNVQMANLRKKNTDFTSKANALQIFSNSNNKEELTDFYNMINGDVFWDEIKSIEITNEYSKYVYDFAVENTENFMLYNGMIVHNSYIGNHRGNLEYKDKLKLFGMEPQGIPGNLMDIIAPEALVRNMEPRDIYESALTDIYRVPLRFICKDPLTLFELTKANQSAQYAAELGFKFKEILNYTNNRPSFDDVKRGIEDIRDRDSMRKLASVYEGLIDKISILQKDTLDDQYSWSAIGRSLLHAVKQSTESIKNGGSQIPRYVVFTLAEAEHPEESKNLAYLSAILMEIYAFAKYARQNRLPISLGIFIDELHIFVRDKDSSSRYSIHDLLNFWGRTNGLLRVFATQKDEQLDSVFRDDLKKLNQTKAGVYSTILGYELLPEAGTAKYLNRSTHDVNAIDEPTYVPLIKTCPPLMCVESPFYDDDVWFEEMNKKRLETKKLYKSDPIYYEPYKPPELNKNLQFDFDSLKKY